MVFSSNIFLFLFLPAFLGIYYLSPERYRSLVILVGSYLFYAWWRVDFVLLFAAVTLFNFYVGKSIAGNLNNKVIAKRWLILGIVGNLSTLGYFKYANFGVDSMNAIMLSMGLEPMTIGHVILPIGISFYIFQAISYIIDVYREDTEPTRNFIDFAAFISLFPQLIAGPVLRYKELADQFVYREHSVEKFSMGATRFMQGFVKKVIIADSIAPLADTSFALSDPTSADAWIGILAYAAQLYFDFSGYSDMAIGLGMMMGFRFPENFNNPYMSQSITEFWKRWHISLSSWLRDYLYIPLGGNRGSTFKTYRNLFLTMVLGGLWHGANWTFVVWGAWHGGILAIERALKWGKVEGFVFHRWLLTFILVLIGWVFFRAPDIGVAMDFLIAMFSFHSMSLSIEYIQGITQLQVTLLVVAYVVLYLSGRACYQRENPVKATPVVLRPAWALLMLPLFLTAVFKLSAQSYSPFLYFQF